MKRTLFSKIALLGMLGFAPYVHAEVKIKSFNFQPYLGWEYQYEHIKPSKAYRNFLSTNFQYSNFFIGTRINKLAGIEVGYYTSFKTSQQQNQAYVFNGQQAGLTATVTTSRYKGFSIDFAGYYQVDSDFHASAILGLVTMHPTLTFQATNGTAFANAFSLITAKNNTVPRLGFGLELLTKHWGLRSRVFWVYTQNVKLNVADAQAQFGAISAYPYVQAIQVTAGLFYRF